jgi:hypothetical protein
VLPTKWVWSPPASTQVCKFWQLSCLDTPCMVSNTICISFYYTVRLHD